MPLYHFFFFQAEDGIRDLTVTGVQTCALPISQRGAQRSGQRRENTMPSNHRSRQSLLRRRGRIRSQREIRLHGVSPLTRRAPAKKVPSDNPQAPQYGKTSSRPTERHRGGKRGKPGPRLRYPNSLRGGGPQTKVHRERLGTRFLQQLLPP